MTAEALATALGVSLKALVRAAARASLVITSSLQVLNGGQQTTATNAVLGTERSGRPKDKRKH